jgi:ABC-2 type transport system permease protein
MRLKPYFLVFKANLAKEMSYRFNFLFTYVLHITRLLIYLTVWSVIFAQGQKIDNYTWDEIASYYILTTILVLLLAPSHMFDLQPLIRKGTLNSILIKPISIEANILAKFLASKIPIFIIMTILTSLVFYFLHIKINLSLNPLAIILFSLSLALTFYFGLFVSALAFWLVEMWPLRRCFQGCMALLGGIIAPLDLLPTYMSSFARFTPFPYLGYFNVKALQGLIPENELLIHCMIGLGWTVLFVLGFKILWNLGLKRYEAVNI